MPDLLSVSRAARIVGVTRGAIQKKIKTGELPTFEGMVRAKDLLESYPSARLVDDSVLERVTHIKEAAFARRVRERVLPDAEVLAARLTELSRRLAEAHEQLDRYKAVVHRLEDRFQHVEKSAGGAQLELIGELKVWLQRELNEGVGRVQPVNPLVVEDSFLRLMAAHVKILPSDNEFFVEGNDTILDAALRAGLALNYGCSNGNCGLCRARVISGHVKTNRHFDYSFTESEKSQGFILMCSNTAVTDLVLDAPEAGGVEEIPPQHVEAKVKGLEPSGDQVMLVHVQTPRSKRLRFLAGQSARLTVNGGLSAQLPIASCPCNDRNLQFHVVRGSGAAFARHVFRALSRGDVVQVDGPEGSFVLDEESTRSIIFVAVDDGFAPIKSLVEHAMSIEAAEYMYLYRAASSGGEFYLNNLCRSWADALDNFAYTPVDDAGDPAALASRIADAHPDMAEFDVYVAGPAGYCRALGAALVERGLPAKRLFTH